MDWGCVKQKEVTDIRQHATLMLIMEVSYVYNEIQPSWWWIRLCGGGGGGQKNFNLLATVPSILHVCSSLLSCYMLCVHTTTCTYCYCCSSLKTTDRTWIETCQAHRISQYKVLGSGYKEDSQKSLDSILICTLCVLLIRKFSKKNIC